MHTEQLIPHLFRTEYRKIIAVLFKTFGFDYIEIAEDIVSDTFLLASETWGQKGFPKNPTAWLYTVAKNKAKDVLKHQNIFTQKIAAEIKQAKPVVHQIEIDLSDKNIYDSQLQMMFAICNPCITTEAQIGLSLHILCGFGAEEIAEAFLTNKETIYKRLSRAKEKLRNEKIKIALPPPSEISKRLETVLTTMYLLFNEGYYSSVQNATLRKDLCLEAMRLTFMLTENEYTNAPQVNALLSLMCFHSSRFDARVNKNGEIILYEDQDSSLWSKELIAKGTHYLNLASTGNKLSKYHVEAAIAYWHTNKENTKNKWENILQLYNKLLQIEYSPIAALNRTYALSKANSVTEAIVEAEKLGLDSYHLYHSLLGELYIDIDNEKSLVHFNCALQLCKTETERYIIASKISLQNQKHP